MVLHMHTYSSYFSEPKAQRIVGGHYFLSLGSSDPSKQYKSPIDNSPLLDKFQLLRHVISSAAESQFGAPFHN